MSAKYDVDDARFMDILSDGTSDEELKNHDGPTQPQAFPDKAADTADPAILHAEEKAKKDLEKLNKEKSKKGSYKTVKALVIWAENLTTAVYRIVGNEKQFPKKWRYNLGNDLIKCCNKIVRHAYKAVNAGRYNIEQVDLALKHCQKIRNRLIDLTAMINVTLHVANVRSINGLSHLVTETGDSVVRLSDALKRRRRELEKREAMTEEERKAYDYSRKMSYLAYLARRTGHDKDGFVRLVQKKQKPNRASSKKQTTV